MQGQSIRNFCGKGGHFDKEAYHQASAKHWERFASRLENDINSNLDLHMLRRIGSRGYHHHHQYYSVYRRKSLLWRMMVLSTVFVAIPAVVFFDAPCKTVALVPLSVLGAGIAIRIAGRLAYVALPLLVVGGATVFWLMVIPSASTAYDLKKLVKRQENAGPYASAIGVLGPNWEIQKAQPNEWFRWSFPERGSKNQLDKVDIRMTVFDPNDHGEFKEQSLQWMDRHKFDRLDEIKRKSKDCDYKIPDSLNITRQGDQFLIQMEDDGEKLMNQMMARKYLDLARLVDKAAKEMEAANPGMNLGEQVVLVHKNNKDSFWNRWSPYGELNLRIPFNRTWVNDLNGF
jgi:hypothetical protein